MHQYIVTQTKTVNFSEVFPRFSVSEGEIFNKAVLSRFHVTLKVQAFHGEAVLCLSRPARLLYTEEIVWLHFLPRGNVQDQTEK